MSYSIALNSTAQIVRDRKYRNRVSTERKQVLFLLETILWFTLLMNVFIQLLKLPSIIAYLNDLFLAFAVIMDYKKIYKAITNTVYGRLILIYFFLCALSSLVNTVSPLLFFWGFRNTFRGLFYLMLLVDLFDQVRVTKTLDKFFYLQILNFFVVLIQYFVFGYQQDWLGGIFGFGVGNGALTNVFNCLLIAYFSVSYINGHNSGIKLIIVVATTLVIAALEEEKFSFVAVVLILFLVLFLTKSSRRKIIYLTMMIVLIGLGFLVFSIVFPSAAEKIMSFGAANEYLTQTGGGYNIPRFGAFSFITENLFQGDLFSAFFGIGFGNSETSNFSFLVSGFYKVFGDYHYRWFVHEWTFIETGYIGFCFYIVLMSSFIIVPVSYLFRNKKQNNDLIITGIIVSVCMLLTICYNATFKADSQYLAYFCCAIGLIGMKEEKHETYDYRTSL